MINERQNLACRMILKAISKTGSLGSCVCLQGDRQQRLDDHATSPVSETAKSRVVLKWLFPSRFSDKDRFTSSRPDIVLVTPTSAKTRKQQTTAGGWVLRSGRGQLRETAGSTPAALPATSRATNPRQHRSEHPSKPRRDIHLVEIKYCADARPQNAAKEQHKNLCNNLQGAFVTLHITLLGVGGTIYNSHTLKPFKELDLDFQSVKNLASKLHVHFVNFAANLVHTRRALSSTIIKSHQKPVSGQACNPLDPH